MKKIIIFLFAFILATTNLFAKNEKKNTIIMPFMKLYDDRYLTFRFKLKEVPCKLQDLQIIGLKMKPSCISDKKKIEKYEKEHQKAIANLLKFGTSYYVTIISETPTLLTCDVSDTRKNIRLLLTKEGYAMPMSDNKELKEAFEYAKKHKKGMFSSKFANLTKCIFEENKKEEPKVEELQTEEPKIETNQNKIEIQIN